MLLEKAEGWGEMEWSIQFKLLLCLNYNKHELKEGLVYYSTLSECITCGMVNRIYFLLYNINSVILDFNY